jgi:hypothetical protein
MLYVFLNCEGTKKNYSTSKKELTDSPLQEATPTTEHSEAI